MQIVFASETGLYGAEKGRRRRVRNLAGRALALAWLESRLQDHCCWLIVSMKHMELVVGNIHLV
jgi:hypothetical protein